MTIKATPAEAPETIQAPQRHIVRTFGGLLRNRQIALLCLIDFLFIGAYLGWSGSTPFLLEHVGGWSAASAHGLVSLALWAHVVGCLVVPTISDRLGLRRPVISIGFLMLGGFGFFSLLLAILLSTNWMSWMFMALAGFCAGVVPLTFTIPVETHGVGPEMAGTAIGILMTSGYLGGYIFPTLTGWISGSNPGVSASISIIILCFLIGYGGAGVVAWFLQETGPKLQKHLSSKERHYA